MVDEILMVTTTVETREQASRLAHQLVEQQLAACVQIEGPMRSVYRWHEKTETAAEWKLSVKTATRVVSTATPWLLHVLRRVQPPAAYEKTPWAPRSATKS